MKREKIFDGKLLKLYKSQLDLPGGKTGYFEEIKHPGASLVVPMYKNKIVFIRQFRAVINKYIWELPAGTLDYGETPYQCAKREVREETGYNVKNIKKIGKIYTTPGFSNEVIHIFKAECDDIIGVEMDPDEVIRTKLIEVKKIPKMLKNGRINDSKTIAALAFAGIL